MDTRSFAQLFRRDLRKLHDELAQYRSEGQLWTVVPGTINSGGVLVQHLIGNLRTYVGLTLGNIPYVRNRDAEFGEWRFTMPQLLQEVTLLIGDIPAVVEDLKETSLSDPYPHDVLSIVPDQDISFVLTHLMMHLAYHTGQLNYHRRISAVS